MKKKGKSVSEARDQKVRQRSPILALTGSIGSGKTSALRLFGDLGWRIYSADQMVHEIYGKKGLDRNEIKKRFGHSRSGLKALVKWVHPLVQKETRKAIRNSRDLNEPALFEIPLLFETGLEGRFDSHIFVYTPHRIRSARVLARGMSKKTFRFLEKEQWKASEKSEPSSYILHNQGDLRNLKAQIQLLSLLFLSL